MIHRFTESSISPEAFICEEAVLFEDPIVASKKIEIGENDSCSVFFINLFFAWAGKKHSTTQHPSMGVLFARQLYKIRCLNGGHVFSPEKVTKNGSKRGHDLKNPARDGTALLFKKTPLGGGFKIFFCCFHPGEMIQFDKHMFQMS